MEESLENSLSLLFVIFLVEDGDDHARFSFMIVIKFRFWFKSHR